MIKKIRSRRIAAFILSAITALSLSSCKGKGILAKTPDMNIPFETEIAIQAGELEAEGTMRRYGTGIWEMDVCFPETEAELSLRYNDDGVRASLGGLELDVPMENINDKAVFALIFKAFDSAAAAGELVCAETENGRVFTGNFSGGEYKLTFDPETLLPAAAEIPSAGICAELSGFHRLSGREEKPAGSEADE